MNFIILLNGETHQINTIIKFAVPAICEEEKLMEQLWEYKSAVFHRYLKKNPATGNNYTTQEVIKDMLQKK